MEITTEILATIEEMPLFLQKELLNYAEYLKYKYNSEIEKKQNDNDIIANFQTSWYEAMTGKTIPVSQMWEELENE
ncbi:DUF2281 domain-containing protein [Geminocystis sp.]|uniref:DUF2281 domain-containing protein n=1 Tax=Geminocystis sp. TaxID=2664100 RepID=UPI0035935E8C